MRFTLLFFFLLCLLGTTWVSHILDLLYFGRTHPERQTSMSIYQRVPFLEISVPLVSPGSTYTWASQPSCKSF